MSKDVKDGSLLLPKDIARGYDDRLSLHQLSSTGEHLVAEMSFPPDAKSLATPFALKSMIHPVAYTRHPPSITASGRFRRKLVALDTHPPLTKPVYTRSSEAAVICRRPPVHL